MIIFTRSVMCPPRICRDCAVRGICSGLQAHPVCKQYMVFQAFKLAVQNHLFVRSGEGDGVGVFLQNPLAPRSLSFSLLSLRLHNISISIKSKCLWNLHIPKNVKKFRSEYQAAEWLLGVSCLSHVSDLRKMHNVYNSAGSPPACSRSSSSLMSSSIQLGFLRTQYVTRGPLL